uniref:Uncharacterized protein n=1 Tax=Fagus sylvatica TaxID=28930 RepID=A0A2N9HD13_FAGSY
MGAGLRRSACLASRRTACGAWRWAGGCLLLLLQFFVPVVAGSSG